METTEAAEATKETKAAATPAVQPTFSQRQANEADDRTMNEWLGAIGEPGQFKVQLYRISPEFMTIRGERTAIKGYVDTIKDVDVASFEEGISDSYGGGKYEVKVQKRGPDGTFKFFRSRTFEIAGRPKPPPPKDGEDDRPVEAKPQSESVPIVQQAMTTMKKVMDDVVERSERKQDSGIDIQAIIDRATAPLQETIRRMDEERKEERKERREAERREPVESPTNKLLERVIDGRDHSVETLRTQFESERRQLNTYWEGQLQRANDHATRQLDQMEKAHDREVASLNRSHDNAVSVLKTSHENIVEGMKREIARLERELGGKDKELAELRAKKDKTPIETIQEMKELKGLFEDEKDDDDGERKSTVERIFEAAITSAPAQAIASRIAAAAPPQQQAPQPTQQQLVVQQQIAQMPFNKPFRLNGRTYMKLEDGQIVPLRQKRKPQQAQQAASEDGTPAEEALPNIAPEDLKTALEYLENAISGRAEPKDFALSAKVMAPQVAGILRKFGSDKLIKMMNPKEESPVFTQRGKGFIRAVEAALTEG